MEHFDFLRHVVEIIERLNLRYFITGSSASIYYGEHRFTNDVDVVVDLPIDRVDEFCRQFPESEYYVSVEAARAAVRSHGMFNVIHSTQGLKLDVIIPEQTAYSRNCMGRVVRRPLAADEEATFGSSEDIILNKLIYYREGGSEKHLRDIASMLKILGDEIDVPYIEQWAERLGLTEEWRLVRDRAGGPPNV
jgi:hypothetical protein